MLLENVTDGLSNLLLADENESVEGKTMKEQLRFSVAYWHTMRGTGADPFGPGTMVRPWEDGTDSVENAQNRVRAALITGDFFVTPPRVIYDLESSLRGVYLDDLAAVVRKFFDESEVEVLSVLPEDFIASIENALSES